MSEGEKKKNSAVFLAIVIIVALIFAGFIGYIVAEDQGDTSSAIQRVDSNDDDSTVQADDSDADADDTSDSTTETE